MRQLPVLLAVGLVAGSAATATAWTPRCQLAIAQESRQLAPPPLERQIDRHKVQFRQGTLAPFTDTPAADHYQNPDGTGDLEKVILRQVDGAIDTIVHHRPFAEIVFRLGEVSHYLADANNPLNTRGDDPQEARYYADYLRYVESAQPRFAPVFYAGDPPVDTAGELRQMLSRTLQRGRSLYPLIGLEYRRIGFASGRQQFDDRSTAFGVAAVSYSHALSDVARVFRYIWVQAGGSDDRTALWARDLGHLLLLPQARPAGR